MKSLTILAMGSAVLAGCTSDPEFVGVPGMREASAAEVGQCRYVTDIRSKPGVYGVLAAQGLRYARNQALATAQEAGANTVVFDPLAPGEQPYELHAVAYSC